jgi:CBS-domain-containing membrane protein
VTQVLLFAAPFSPFSQPRNVIGGHAIAIVVGVACAQVLAPVIAAPMAIALVIMVQMATETIHPPGGGAALIAVSAAPKIIELGWLFCVPVAISVLVLLAAAMLNNLFVCCSAKRRYPSGGVRKLVCW